MTVHYRFFRLVPSIDENAVISQTRLRLDVEPLPGLSVADGASRSTGDSSIQSDSDSCRAVVDLKFVTGDDNDSIVIATQHPSGKEQTFDVFGSCLSDDHLFLAKIQVDVFNYGS